jgi:glutathione S-transferase
MGKNLILYYAPGACSLANVIILNELAIPYELEMVDLVSKITRSGDNYLLINPKGSVPALLTRDDTLLTETLVIQQYLAEEFKADNLLLQNDKVSRYKILTWMSYCTADLHKGCASPLYNQTLPHSIKQNFYEPMLMKKLQYINQHLKARLYLVGSDFKLADANIFVILSWLQ